MGRVDNAMRTLERRDFLPDGVKDQANFDGPLSIGYGQTNSQPYTVRSMLEWLEAQKGQRILDVGSGSGWTTALLSKLTGETGRVYAVELVPELLEMGRTNCERVGCENAEFHPAGRTFGLPEHAPYDRILVSAATDEMSDELIKQLNTPGTMVIPVGHSIWKVNKDKTGKIEKEEHPGFMFVPLLPASER